MPVVKQYSAQVDPLGGVRTRDASAADFGGQEAAGLHGLGQDLQSAAGILHAQQIEEDVSNVRVKMAESRAQWDVAFAAEAQKADPSDNEFAARFTSKYGETVASMRGMAQTRKGQEVFDLLASQTGAHLTEKAGIYQAQLAGAQASQNFKKTVAAAGTSLLVDPTQREALTQQVLDGLNDPNSPYARLTATDRIKLVDLAKSNLTRDYVRGLIAIGAPELALRQLKSGKGMEDLDPVTVQTLMNSANAAIHQKETLKDRADMIARREKHDLSEKTRGEFVAMIIDPKNNQGDSSDKAIMAAVLSGKIEPGIAEHLATFKLQRAHNLAALAENRKNPALVRALMDEMIERNLNNPDRLSATPIFDAYTTGRMVNGKMQKISDNEYVFLQNQFRSLHDASTNSFTRDFNSIIGRISFTMQRDPFAKFDALTVIDGVNRLQADASEYADKLRRKDGTNPRSMLDPKSPDYFFTPGRVGSYFKTGPEIVKDAAARAVGVSGVIQPAGSTVDYKGLRFPNQAALDKYRKDSGK